MGSREPESREEELLLSKVTRLGSIPRPEQLVPGEITLESMGYFTPSWDREPLPQTEKTKKISITRDDYEGEVVVRILANPAFGLPVTRDRNLFLALMQIIWHIWNETGRIPKYVTFSTRRILMLARMNRGRDWNTVKHFRRKLQATLIMFDADIQTLDLMKFNPDASYQLFGSSTGTGEMDDDEQEAHVVELSEWFRDRLARWFVRPLDVEGELSLQSPIAKALSPVLDAMFFAANKTRKSASGPIFVAKRYEDLVDEFLLVARHGSRKRIKRQFTPPCNDLMSIGKLTSWEVRRAKRGEGWVLEFGSGPRMEEIWQLWKDMKLPSGDGRVPRLLPPVIPIDDPEVEMKNQATLLVKMFQSKKNKLDNWVPTRKEWEQALAYIRRNGFDDAAQMVDITVQFMNQTKYGAQFFGAVPPYESKARRQLDRARSSQLRTEESAKRKAQEEQAKRLERETLASSFDALSEEERRRRLQEARAEIEAEQLRLPNFGLKLDYEALARAKALKKLDSERSRK